MRTKLIIIGGVVTLLPLSALAMATASGVTVTAAQQAAVSQRCQRITSNIANRITIATQRQQRLATDHQTIETHWGNVVTRAGVAGVSATGLQADLTTYTADAATAASDSQAYLGDLSATQNSTCGQSKGAFAAAVTTARTAFATWRTEETTLHNLRVSTNNGDLKTVLQQLGSKKTTNASTK
jgi:hypothetical protein